MLDLQNKMVMGAKERQDVEMAAQQETLEEQRSHIQILDSALSQAQAQVLRLEEESRSVGARHFSLSIFSHCRGHILLSGCIGNRERKCKSLQGVSHHFVDLGSFC